MDEIITLTESAIHLHELYLSFEEAGFTEDQAITLVGMMIAATIGKGGQQQ